MPLKASEIADLIVEKGGDEKDPFIVTPRPDLTKLRESGAAAIDIRLGTWFLTSRQSRLALLSVAMEPNDQHREPMITKRHYVPFGGQFVLHPRSFVLAATLEWIRFPTTFAGYIHGKSSWGRRGLIIATASGIHPGFTGCLTLEVTNLGEVPIEIRPGMAICQLFIHRTGTREESRDQSGFVGFRRPTLGKIELDETARLLANVDKKV